MLPRLTQEEAADYLIGMYRNDRIDFASTFFHFRDSCRLYRRFLFDDGRNDGVLQLFHSSQITFLPFFFAISLLILTFAA